MQQKYVYYIEKDGVNKRKFCLYLKERIFIIIIVVFFSGVVGGIIDRTNRQLIYESTGTLYILSNPMYIGVPITYRDMELRSKLADDYLIIIKSRSVLGKVIDNLNLELTIEDLADIVSVTTPANTRILNITVQTSKDIDVQSITNELMKVGAVSIANIVQEPVAQIVDMADYSKWYQQRGIIRAGILFSIVGGAFIFAIFLVKFLLYKTIRTDEDVINELKVPVLAQIPVIRRKKIYGRKKR